MYLGAVLLALFLVIPSRAGEAQPAMKIARIGYLSLLSSPNQLHGLLLGRVASSHGAR
jgi:hypothetical protein